MPFGNLRAARETAGLTRCGLGALVDRTGRTVGRWEDGSIAPKPAERLRLAEVLGADVGDLFPPFEPGVIVAARAVAASRTVPDLQRSVAHLRAELATLDERN